MGEKNFSIVFKDIFNQIQLSTNPSDLFRKFHWHNFEGLGGWVWQEFQYHLVFFIFCTLPFYTINMWNPCLQRNFIQVFHVSGGRNSSTKFSDILAWDPIAEQWSQAGQLSSPRWAFVIVFFVLFCYGRIAAAFIHCQRIGTQKPTYICKKRWFTSIHTVTFSWKINCITCLFVCLFVCCMNCPEMQWWSSLLLLKAKLVLFVNHLQLCS